MKKYYYISIMVDRYSFQKVYLTTSFEDAKNHIFDFADQAAAKGTCQITEINENCKMLKIYRFEKGKLINTYKL